MVERLVRELRERFGANDGREREQRQPPRRPPQARGPENDEQAVRGRHLEIAIEHLQAAGMHDLAQELRGQMHQPQPGPQQGPPPGPQPGPPPGPQQGPPPGPQPGPLARFPLPRGPERPEPRPKVTNESGI